MWLAQYIPSKSSNSIRPTAERHNRPMPTTSARRGITTTQKAILRCRARACSPARDAAGSDLPVGLHNCSMQLFLQNQIFQDALKLPVDAAWTASPNETLQHLRSTVKRLYSPISPDDSQPFDCGRISPW